MPEFQRVVTLRLVLRRLRAEDLGALVAYRNDPEVARYQRWTDSDASRGRQQAEAGKEPAP